MVTERGRVWRGVNRLTEGMLDYYNSLKPDVLLLISLRNYCQMLNLVICFLKHKFKVSKLY